ncbi:MAG: segregation and condensation protein A [Chromatiaceae bacterium]|nr:segregation and condensation protein A [Gammaproteobacteria bacterium]MCB1860634.1 segregation and condensation protein A [Gammaproteobacteria bacterium]MCB1879779.1 segregation and condensation protein A [Gammaproteobacteria bacterium]MCB1903165.1 segregation and condensation protein A [Gammaproteobacteria bacterium]MCP5445642.1 segregation and condensation protein A [Chromatiaceae bacterium]
MDESTKEREILKVMRQVLGSVIKEITPPPGIRHPLSAKTIEDVRICLGLIAARERELAERDGIEPERPFFADDPQAAKVIPMSNIGKIKKTEESGD